MNVQDLLERSPFEQAQVWAGKGHLNRTVNTANILEAVDIENWGEPNQIILTSYFALERLNEAEIDAFFRKMDAIGISGLVLKLDRLVSAPPETLIAHCERFKLPLITVPKTVKYETILFAVLRPIINHNANLLEKYYQTRQVLNKLTPKMPTLEEMLQHFHRLLGLELQLYIPLKNQTLSTHPHYNSYRILNSQVLPSEKFMSFTYTRHQLWYDAADSMPASMVTVEIPNLEFQNYRLAIFEVDRHLNELDFMIIENAVEFLQAELIKNYAIKHSQFLKKNDLMVDLLNTRYYSTVEQEELLSLVGLNQYSYYQGIMISVYDYQNMPGTYATLFLQAFTQAMRDTYSNLAYYSKNNRIIFLKNLHAPDQEFKKTDLLQLVEKVMSQHLPPDISSIFCHIALSAIHSRNSLKEINKECLDTTKMMTHFYQDTRIMQYDNLGIFKYFLETDSLSELEKFIPKDLAKLRIESPELFKTLKVFLLENQNHVNTASKLFIHPKTVRYRLERIKEMLDVNLDDAEQVLLYQIAIRLYEFM